MKVCSKCKNLKDATDFNKCARSSDGLFSWCRDCTKAMTRARYKQDPDYWLSRTKKWTELNRERSRVIKQRYVKANPERDLAQKQKWRRENLEKDRQVKNNWSKNNRAYCNTNLAEYRARKLHATPSWAEPELMELVYAEAKYRGLHVDHIVPLRGDTVCGLHVYYNMQLLTQAENAQKRNIWPYELRIPL